MKPFLEGEEKNTANRTTVGLRGFFFEEHGMRQLSISHYISGTACLESRFFSVKKLATCLKPQWWQSFKKKTRTRQAWATLILC